MGIKIITGMFTATFHLQQSGIYQGILLIYIFKI